MRHLFLRVVRAACCDPHQRLQPNQLPLGLTGLWRRCALCVALEHGASRWRGRSLLSCRSCVHWLCIHGCIFWAEANCFGCSPQVAGLGHLGGLCFGHFTTSPGRTFHEPHTLDLLALLDCRLDQSPCFLQISTESQGLLST